jgi:hypothetical protein
MEKKNNWAPLEVADFVVHTAGCQARRGLTDVPFRLDFINMFQGFPNSLASYVNIGSVRRNPSGAEAPPFP